MKSILIGVVGTCAAGKTTLAHGLRLLGYHAKPIAQEHSYVPDMWLRLTHPDVLIYLEVSFPLTIERRKLEWTREEYAEQLHRLRHARQHAHLTIDTDSLTPEEILTRVHAFIDSSGRGPLHQPNK
jgi:deoxyadenosine/deoxycytidine kinase